MGKSLTAIFITGMILFFACSDGSGPSGGNTLQLGTMEAEIDGTTWISLQALAYELDNIIFRISGKTKENDSLSITIFNVYPGIYHDGTGSYTIIDTLNTENNLIYSSESVSYQILSFDNEEILGTFSFNATDQNTHENKAIANGRFRVEIKNK